MVMEAASCPQCGAGLQVPEGRMQVDCPYCHTTSFVREGRLVRRQSRRSGAVAVVGLAVLLLLGGTTAYWLAPARAPTSVNLPSAPVRPMEPEPDFLASEDAMIRMWHRILERTGGTGRVRFMTVGTDHTVVAQVEVEAGIDTAVLSWGHTIVNPLAMTAEERARLPEELFDLTDAVVGGVVGRVTEVLAEQPEGTVLERVDFIGLGGPPRMQFVLTHPRHVIEPVELPL